MVELSNDRERKQAPTRRKQAPTRRSGGADRWTIVGTLGGLVIGALSVYLPLAVTQHWAPFELTCQSVLNKVPDSIDRSTAGAFVHGDGQARVVWRPPHCTGSGPIVRYIVYAYDFDTKKYLPAQYTSGTSRSDIYIGLTDGQHYNFGIQAVNSIGPSLATYTNVVMPPNQTQP